MKQTLIILLLCFQIFSINAQEWKELVLTDYDDIFFGTTTEKSEDGTTYKALNLFDSDYTTAWIEGNETKENLSVFVSIPTPCNSVNLVNGYAKNINIYNKYSRAKKIRVTCHAGINPMGYVSETSIVFMLKTYPEDFYINLADIDSIQTFTIPFETLVIKHFKDEATSLFAEQTEKEIYQVAMILQMEIIEKYDGKTNSVSLSEIFFNDSYVTDYRQQKFNNIKKVYIDEEDEGKLLIDYNNENKVPIIDNPDYVLQIAEESRDMKWITVIRMPANITDSRVSTEYLVVNTHLGQIMNSKIEKTSGVKLYSPLFLEEKHGDTFLVHSNGEIRLK